MTMNLHAGWVSNPKIHNEQDSEFILGFYWGFLLPSKIGQKYRLVLALGSGFKRLNLVNGSYVPFLVLEFYGWRLPLFWSSEHFKAQFSSVVLNTFIIA